MELEQLYGLSGVVVVVGLIEGIKKAAPGVDSRYWPILSVIVGILYNMALAAVLGLPLGPAAIIGLVSGLSAGGLYSGGRTFAEKRDPTQAP